jgi:hypothetical protein
MGNHARGLVVGVVLAALNGVAWAAFLHTATTPISVELPGVYGPPPTMSSSEGRLDVGVEGCADCPSYVLLDRGVMSSWAPLHLKALWWANGPALWLASHERLRYGVRVVRPALFFVFSSLQWIAIGYVGYRLLKKVRTPADGVSQLAESR